MVTKVYFIKNVKQYILSEMNSTKFSLGRIDF